MINSLESKMRNGIESLANFSPSALLETQRVRSFIARIPGTPQRYSLPILMKSTSLIVERHGKNARATVNKKFERAFAQVLGLVTETNKNPSFADCMAWLLEHKDDFGQHSDERIASFHQHYIYYLNNLTERNIDPVAVWAKEGAPFVKPNLNWLRRYLPEFLSRITVAILGWKPDQPPGLPPPDVFKLLQDRTASYSSPATRQKVPYAVLGLPSEANLNLLFKYFEMSFEVPGDVCEFGCFRGATSVKMAFMLKALGQDKTVYAFDTFEGFQINDPGGGDLGVGAYADILDSYNELSKWSNVLPLKPIKGDATKTCRAIVRPLSFVWLDLDMGVLLGPVLDYIWPYIGPDTIIGVDDVARPETPTVYPWVEEMLKTGRLKELAFHKDEYIGIYKRA